MAMVDGNLVKCGRCEGALEPKPKDDEHGDTLGLAIYNTAKEAIVIEAVDCKPDTSRVSFRDDWRDILDPDWKDGIAIIAPAAHKVFWWHPGANWSHQKPEDKVRITIRWSFTSSRWYWLPPVKRAVTVGRLPRLLCERRGTHTSADARACSLWRREASPPRAASSCRRVCSRKVCIW